MVTTEAAQLIAECFCIYTDQDTSESMAYDRELGFRSQVPGWIARRCGPPLPNVSQAAK